ncbi:MAG TPA: hypothetical protein VG672_23640 [Bryobacteraceae bacterium]|jgi:hypothetical protein|nr:hypothetical protein [Bryobacteraceae bacterium]
MGFLDNLENNLKSLESQDESSGREQVKQRESARQEVLAAAPYAELLKSSPYTAELLKQVTRAGHAARMKVHLAWLGTTLRLEAREHRLELRPTPAGVVAVFLDGRREAQTQPVDFEADPRKLAEEWVQSVMAAG